MKLVFLCLKFLAFIAIWRLLSSRGGLLFKCVQGLLHRCPGSIAGLLQWYSLLFIGFCMLMCETYWSNILLLKADWLSPKMPIWVRCLSKASLVAGVVAFALLIAHFASDALKGKHFRDGMGQEYPWAPSKRQDMVFCVISVPAIYIAMSAQSTARMWMVIDETYGQYGKDVDLALYEENLDLAAISQYYVVFVFSSLCWVFVKERASTETQTIIRFAGFQGVHVWVLVGLFRALADFGMSYAVAHYPDHVATYGALATDGIEKLDSAFAVLTLLCVYNMFLICRFEPIKDALGNANAKFLGTRLLLLLGQIQPRVTENPIVMEHLGLTRYTGKLLHSSLLTMECLVVILFNYFSWEFGVKKELLHDARSLEERRHAAETGMAAPLLSNP